MTGQILDEHLAPTAIFAANNAIALGVIEALRARGLQIPRDLALVCFDDYPYITSFFPFLTVVAQPAYEMGANAAQLLLSRLQSPVPLKPRRVVLPVRLIVRYSCGSGLGSDDRCPLNLPLVSLRDERVSLVKPLSADELPGKALNSVRREQVTISVPSFARPRAAGTSLLRDVLRHKPAERIPHIELRIANPKVYEYVLERAVQFAAADPRQPGVAPPPEVQIELAQRLGLDAVACELPGQSIVPTDLNRLRSPAPLAAQLNYLESYLRVAQGSNIGVFVSVQSFYASALTAIAHKTHGLSTDGDIARLEQAMDALLMQRMQMIRAVCDRFGADLAFVLVDDNIADRRGLTLPPALFEQLFVARMQKMIAPALEHGLITVLHTDGYVEPALPLIKAAGFDVVHGLASEWHDLPRLRRAWAGKLALMGGISDRLLAEGRTEDIAEAVRQLCAPVETASGFVLGSANGITEAVPPANFVALTLAVQKHGRNNPAVSENALVVSALAEA